MQHNQTVAFASSIVIVTGALWGLYWVPLRALAEGGLAGAWGSLAIVAVAVVVLAPVAWRRRAAVRAADPWGLAFVALGGFAFVLYSVALIYGRVAIIAILFFLTPVWSVMIGRVVMGWRASWLRVLALGCGIVGLALILGADGEVPLPQGLGEWMGLMSGILWSVATTGIRVRSDRAVVLGRPEAGPGEQAFVFAFGAVLGAAVLAPMLEPVPALAGLGDGWALAGWALAAGGLWWGLSMAALMWATARLEPVRVGLLLMTEVLVGAVSAALIAGEGLGTVELLGGGLVLLAGVLEVWPQGKARQNEKGGRRDRPFHLNV